FNISQHGNIYVEETVDDLVEDAPVYNLPTEEAAYYKRFQQEESIIPVVESHSDMLKKLLSQPTIPSKEAVYSKYETNAQGNTITGPGSSAAIVEIEGTKKAIPISTYCNSYYIYLDPKMRRNMAVSASARNIVCAGAKTPALTIGLNFRNQPDTGVVWQIEKSINGINEASRELNTPVISRNVTL